MSVRNEAELAEAIQSVDRIHIGGSATRGGGDFSLAELSGVVEYSPDELTITVKAGTSIAEVEATLGQHNQMLAFEPMDHRTVLKTQGNPTIGGALGINADGPRRLRYGAMRDAVLGLRFVDGQGQILRAGGKVMKNVTGLDITRLMIGSHGVLGAVSEVTIKVLPNPKAVRSVAIEIDADAVSEAMGKLMRQPLDISGLHWSQGKLYLRIENTAPDDAISRIKQEFGALEDIDSSRWIDFRDWIEFVNVPELWRVFTKPSQIEELLTKDQTHYAIACGGAQVLMSRAPEHLPNGSHAYCVKGNKAGQRLGVKWPQKQALIRKVRAVFDPHGKFYGQEGRRHSENGI